MALGLCGWMGRISIRTTSREQVQLRQGQRASCRSRAQGTKKRPGGSKGPGARENKVSRGPPTFATSVNGGSHSGTRRGFASQGLAMMHGSRHEGEKVGEDLEWQGAGDCMQAKCKTHGQGQMCCNDSTGHEFILAHSGKNWGWSCVGIGTTAAKTAAPQQPMKSIHSPEQALPTPNGTQSRHQSAHPGTNIGRWDFGPHVTP